MWKKMDYVDIFIFEDFIFLEKLKYEIFLSLLKINMEFPLRDRDETTKCRKCNLPRTVSCQLQTRTRAVDELITHLFICLECGKTWIRTRINY